MSKPIEKCSFRLNVSTKKEKFELPSLVEATLRPSIDYYGGLRLDMWAPDSGSPFATLDITDPQEMRYLANILTSLAAAMEAVDGVNLCRS